MTESLWFTDSLVRIHCDTGRLALLEILAPHAHQPPPHTHDEDEVLFVLEGELTVITADGEQALRAGQGDCVAAGVPHTVRVTSASPARVLVATAPGRFAGFMRAAGRPAEREALPVVDGPPDVERIVAAAEANGMQMLPSLEPVPA